MILRQARSARVGAANYIASATWHPNGLLASTAFGNGQLFSQSLNSRQLPSLIQTAKPGGETALALSYAYDVRAKVSSISDAVNAAENRSFAYDAAGRLLTASGPWGSGSYVYDALGNLRQRVEGPVVASIAYDSTNRVTSSNEAGVVRNFSYDDRGNATTVGPYAFAYDHSNQPVALSGGAVASYAYDANLKRVKEVRGGKTIYTIYSAVTGSIVYRDETTDDRKTDYASVGPASLRLVKTGAGAPVPDYTHADHLGSPLAATDASGAVLWRESYAPFGAALLRPPANDNNTGFTSHLADRSTNLVYMQARYYDPYIGRFLSTDPIGYQDQLNLYAYVRNDPINAWDPTGLKVSCTRGSGKSAVCYDDVSGTTSDVPHLSDKDLERLNALVEPDDVSRQVDSALRKSTFEERLNGLAGRNVDPDQRYVYTRDGWVDLQHVVSATALPQFAQHLTTLLGVGVEAVQAVGGVAGALTNNQVGKKSWLGSALQPEDFRSNAIGQQAAVVSRMKSMTRGNAVGELVKGRGAMTGRLAIKAHGGKERDEWQK